MKLTRVSIKNFRLLRDAKIRLSDPASTTVLVGPNNSGKTSVAEALMLLAGGGEKHISVFDFSLGCRPDFDKAELAFLGDDAAVIEATKLPSITLDMSFEYNDQPGDLTVASDLLMDLDPTKREVALRTQYGATDIVKLAKDYRETRKKDEKLFDFLRRELKTYFGIKYFKMSLDDEAEIEPIEEKALVERLIKVDFVFAQRHIDDQENNRATRLSHLLNDHYEKHYKAAEPENYEEIEQKLGEHAAELGGRYMKAFDGLIQNLKHFGYSQRAAPALSIRAEISSRGLFRDNTRIYYGVANSGDRSEGDAGKDDPPPPCELPEKYNGLGFKNLIYIILQIQSFRVAVARMVVNRPRVHLIFIEEPETHLHPQVQSVFIKQISDFLKKDAAGDSAQIVLTTHSSHIVADCGFTPIRYFRAKAGQVTVKDLLNFEETMAAEPEIVRFLTKYVSQVRCDLFFADKAILVEGQVEKLLMPKMISEISAKAHSDFVSEYISVMEVGGAHAHKFKALLKFIEVPTLIITDFDAVNDAGKACRVSDGKKTSNGMLKDWLPKLATVSELLGASDAAKMDGCIRVAYQTPEGDNGACGRSFEEAFIYRNAAWISKNSPSFMTTASKFAGRTAQTLTTEAYDLTPAKVDFALDLIAIDGWETPSYIADGLTWLASRDVS